MRESRIGTFPITFFLLSEPNCDGIEIVLDVQPRDVHLQNRGKLGCWVVNSNEKRGGGSGF